MESQGETREKKENWSGYRHRRIKPKIEALCNTVIFHMVKKEGLYVADNVSCLPNRHSLPFFLANKTHSCLGRQCASSKD